MKVEYFNTSKGLYIFKLDSVDTEFHSHPTVEIILAEEGTFTLWTGNLEYQDLKFAVIEANQLHKLTSTNGKLKIIMIEHVTNFVKVSLADKNIFTNKGLYTQQTEGKEESITNTITQKIQNSELTPEYDERIWAAIKYLNVNDLEYSLMLKTLQSVTNLSESRLSHLFKANIGISIKRYLVWSKLKSTIKYYLTTKEDLFSALMNSGFYDQPHFSKMFKVMLGVKPSMAYNSRTLQVSPFLIP